MSVMAEYQCSLGQVNPAILKAVLADIAEELGGEITFDGLTNHQNVDSYCMVVDKTDTPRKVPRGIVRDSFGKTSTANPGDFVIRGGKTEGNWVHGDYGGVIVRVNKIGGGITVVGDYGRTTLLMDLLGLPQKIERRYKTYAITMALHGLGFNVTHEGDEESSYGLTVKGVKA